VGARVVVAENDSMYRGVMGVIVERNMSRTARLNNFQRQMLNTGGVLVERNEGSLFVVPAHFLENSMMSTTRIDELEAELKRREDVVREAELELREAIARHCDDHPLLCMIVDAMIERVRDGMGLCCQSGHDCEQHRQRVAQGGEVGDRVPHDLERTSVAASVRPSHQQGGDRRRDHTG
jgi:hypothetical protein